MRSTRQHKAQGQPGEKKYCLSLTFLGESFLLSLTQHRALPHSPEHLPAHSSHCPRGRAPAGHPGGSEGALAKQLCPGVWDSGSDPGLPLQPSAWQSPAGICLKPEFSEIYLKSLTAKCPNETGKSFCDVQRCCCSFQVPI